MSGQSGSAAGVDCDCTVCAYAKKHPQIGARRCWHVNGDTITDEQIRGLRSAGDARGDLQLVYVCCDALRVHCDGRPRVDQDASAKARARCAEILNARAVS